MKWLRFLWLKKYFDTGWGLMNQGKYALILFGVYDVVTTENMWMTIFMAFLYCCFCFIVGMWWVKQKMYETEQEINNILNPYQRQMREKLKIEKYK